VERATRPAGGQGTLAVRRLILLTALAGCAQPGMPPGGPPDREPPAVVRITPDTNSLNVRRNSVVFDFDEVVSERPQGAPTLVGMFEVSPSTGPVSVSWRRTHVEVKPHGGLRPNTTYTVRLLPGMMDLSQNVDSTGVTVVFSTGSSLASGVVDGRVFDWLAGRPAARAYVEAISLPDSARWSTTADSAGAFSIEHMPPGTYLVRAIIDQNRNQVVDARELFDSLTVSLADTFHREMLAAIRDSLGPGVASVEPKDSLTWRVVFDRPLDTLFVPTVANFTLKTQDSAGVPIAQVLSQADLDRLAADSARVRAVQDSVRQAAIADSIRTADSAQVAAAPPRPTGRRPGAATRAPILAPEDSTDRPPPKPQAALPVNTLFLRLSAPLVADTNHRLRAIDFRSVTGGTRTSDRVFRTPKPAAKPDSGAKPDTGSRGARD